MSNLPKKCILDTNVPKIANRALNPDNIPDDLINCVSACVQAIEGVTSSRTLLLDSGGEIFQEYRHQLSLSGQPGVGDSFIKWVHDNLGRIERVEQVSIHKKGSTYKEFPYHKDLRNFDKSDRKFVAVANAHPEKPPILQATDSKWWGWKDALEECGITVEFLCKPYVIKKYKKKTGS